MASKSKDGKALEGEEAFFLESECTNICVNLHGRRVTNV